MHAQEAPNPFQTDIVDEIQPVFDKFAQQPEIAQLLQDLGKSIDLENQARQASVEINGSDDAKAAQEQLGSIMRNMPSQKLSGISSQLVSYLKQCWRGKCDFSSKKIMTEIMKDVFVQLQRCSYLPCLQRNGRIFTRNFLRYYWQDFCGKAETNFPKKDRILSAAVSAIEGVYNNGDAALREKFNEENFIVKEGSPAKLTPDTLKHLEEVV